MFLVEEGNAMTDQPLSKKTVNVIPELHGYGRPIAPDLIGMGDSDKLLNPGPTTYTFSTHRNHLWAFIDAVVGSVDKMVLVIHDWGAALGFDWANHHRERLRNRVHGRPRTRRNCSSMRILAPFLPDDSVSIAEAGKIRLKQRSPGGILFRRIRAQRSAS
jgi:pimeloyl-ACP methyl ester carboxylesterase